MVCPWTFMTDAICHKNGDGDGSPDDLFVLSRPDKDGRSRCSFQPSRTPNKTNTTLYHLTPSTTVLYYAMS